VLQKVQPLDYAVSEGVTSQAESERYRKTFNSTYI